MNPRFENNLRSKPTDLEWSRRIKMATSNAKFVEMVRALHAEGKTKDQVLDTLQDEGIRYKDIPKVMKDAGVKFGSGGSKGWREASSAAFIENPDLTLDEYIELLRNIPDLKNHEVKAKYHYKMMADIAQALSA